MRVCFLALLAFGPGSAPGSEPESEFQVPDMGLFLGTWLWRSSEGMVVVSTPQTKGASRTLILNPDLTYEYHQRRGTRDSVLCEGRFSYSEQTVTGGVAVSFLDFENWFESYEHRMFAGFEGPDSLHLVGEPCNACPEHLFVRGRSASFGAAVKRGEPFRRDLWDGLRFELRPLAHGWEVVVGDTTRPGENLARLTPSLLVPDPDAPRKNRDFVFSREVGKDLPAKEEAPDDHGHGVESEPKGGWGTLTVEDLTPDPGARGGKAGVESMRFRVAIEEMRGRAEEGRP